MKRFTLEKYKNQWAIYAVRSRCFVMFGTKKEMTKRLQRLNKELSEDD